MRKYIRRCLLLTMCMMLLGGCQSKPEQALSLENAPLTESSSLVDAASDEIPKDSSSSPATFSGKNGSDSETANASRYRISVGCSTMLDFPEEYVCEDGSIIEFVTYPDGILGDDMQLLRGCQAGTISMYKGASTIAAEIIPELSLLGIPSLVKDEETVKSMEQNLKNYFQPYYQEKGLQLLNFCTHGTGSIVSSIPLYSRADFSKVHIRSTANNHNQLFWSSLGMKVSQIPFNELEYQLQKKDINAIEGGMTAIEHAGFLSVLQEQNFDYVIDTNQSVAVGNVVMNLEEYNALPEAVQSALQELSAASWSTEMTPIEFAEKYNLTVITPNEEVQAVLNEGREVVIEHLQGDLGKKKVEEFLSFIDSIQ